MGHAFSILPPRVTWADVRPPFLCIRLMSGVYSLQQLPPDFSREALVTLGWSTMEALGRLYRLCVVFGWMDTAFLDLDGTLEWGAWLPCGGVNVDPDPDLLAFLPIVVDPSRQRPPQPVYWPEEWDWAAVLKARTEVMRAAWAGAAPPEADDDQEEG